MPVKVGDIVLCTVKKIEATVVTVEVEKKEEGTIVMSEIAAGRIRNLREYVAPNKKIVCKVISTDNGHTQLSLRRVTARERDEAISKNEKEKTLIAMIKAISKEHESIVNSIKKEYELADFSDEIKSNHSLLDKFFKKSEAEQISKILNDKKEVKKEVKRNFVIRTLSESGLEDIKSSLSIKEANIHYLGSSQFSVSASGRDFKEANTKITAILHEIETKAKSKKMLFEIKE